MQIVWLTNCAGIDEADAAQVIKTISDAPLPRKGPLPQDFQDALSIIFPGDRKPDDDEAATAAASASATAAAAADVPNGTSPAPVDQSSQPNDPIIIATPSIVAEPLTAAEVMQKQQHAAAALQLQLDEQSQQSMDLYSAFAVVNGVAMLKSDHLADTAYTTDERNIPDSLPVTQVPLPPEKNNDETAANVTAEAGALKAREAEMKAARQAELDDLAMLGIDADDLAAQCM